MPFDHNDHYHRLLVRQLPRGCRTALDVGCGTGRFARRLAGLGVAVDAIDPSAEVIAAARAADGGANPQYRQADIREAELPCRRYEFISCLASLHHVPFETVTVLREALAPGGVLVVLGCYPERSRLDWAWSLAAVPVNAAARLAVWAAERLRRAPAAAAEAEAVQAPVRPPTMTLAEIRQAAAELLPGAKVRRLLFWRYLLVYRADGPVL
ncbi:bifunctional 2-polyprenyl-6-hydroxyphenol methylase/3-demethylubiquinol 3-O-methyltransferase UbiG [Kitasatospora sp. MMS16-BH015]|uniref:class I SAM-dependent methyltransferase n=1 Tax=Kitasatospora sp. MMS16-BH015 TaxID=2018025 RepID=UPI000CF1F63D|nr:class I SAM-dependent methyltransferase [Kitasatospora sp. MMS16-BH015]